MNFLSIEYFIAVAAKKSITKAAEELYITQQTLSAHISSIEKELACQLIVRSNPLELTYAGEIFLKYASIFYENYQSMWNEFNDITNNQRGKLLIGVDYTRSRSIMPEIITAFHECYPNIEVRLLEGSNKSLHKSLINKDIDIAIACFPDSIHGIEIRNFYEEEVVMLVPKKFLPESVNGKNHIDDLSEFSTCPFVLGSLNDITSQIDRNMIMKSGFQPIIKAQSDNIETRLLLCVKGTGICFCPESFINTVLTHEQLQNVCICHFNTEITYPIRFGYRKSSYQWKMITEFIRIALKEKELDLI